LSEDHRRRYRLSLDTVDRRLRDLERNGLIKREPRKRGNGSNRSSMVTLMIGAGDAKAGDPCRQLNDDGDLRNDCVEARRVNAEPPFSPNATARDDRDRRVRVVVGQFCLDPAGPPPAAEEWRPEREGTDPTRAVAGPLPTGAEGRSQRERGPPGPPPLNLNRTIQKN
jgi:hypothetical protein